MEQYITKCPGGAPAVAVDDTIMTEGILTTAGSRMLYNFVPLFDAEAVARLKAAGYAVSGKTRVGEFGLDVLGETCYGGASLGAAAQLVASGEAQYALNVDLNGAPRRAAAVHGVTFAKPTYGTVSRYGVIPCASSGEQIGVTAKTAREAAALLAVIAGHDPKDGTSLPDAGYKYEPADTVRGLRVGIPAQYLERCAPEMAARVRALGGALRGGGAEVGEFSLPEAALAQPAWQILMAAETCNNLSRYDGVKFGYRAETYKNIDELYTSSRTEAFSLLTKWIILYGSDVLSTGRYDDCYDKSLRIRRVLREALNGVFAKYDLLLSPACAKPAYTAEELGDSIDAVYDESFYTALASITGIPAVVSGGVMLTGDSFSERTLFTAAAYLEKEARR